MAGVRDSKTVDGVTYNYLTLDGKVVRQTWTQNGKERVFDIIYDASGQPYACVYEGYRYYYVLNQQGDVIRIVGSGGLTCAEYKYDAWGNVLEISGLYKGTLGAVNPIRYRGYYYDTETGFYYLQSRYYDPSIGRFINVDSFSSTGQGFLGYNMFAYCGNDPTNNTDPTGHAIWGTNIVAICDGGCDYPKEKYNPYDPASPYYAGHIPDDCIVIDDPMKVLEPNVVFTNYNGVPVIRCLSGGSGLSFGIILIGSDVGSDESGADLLNHEYGHYLHLQDIGWTSYTVNVAIPSLTGSIGASLGILPVYYYDQPWEYIADQYGGVDRGCYSQATPYISEMYYYHTQLIGLVFP